MIAINRVTKVVKGGRIMGFAALTWSATAMAASAWARAKRRKCRSPCKKRWTKRAARWSRCALKNGTLHHAVIGRHGSTRVSCSRPSDGTGIIAGGPMRAIFEVMGVTNVLAKCHRLDQSLQRRARDD